MPTVFVIEDAEPATPSEPAAQLQPWVGSLNGQFIGIMTDPPGLAVSGPEMLNDPEAIHHHHIAAVQKVTGHESLPAITRLSVYDRDQVFAEMWPEQYAQVSVLVDGVPVPADTVKYRGLEWAFGRELLRYPFVLFRLLGADEPWPELVEVEEVKSVTR